MADTLALVQQVALYLGQPWKFNHLKDYSYHRYEIIDGYGRGLFLIQDYNKPKLKIYGQFPPAITSRYHRFSHSIGVSAERPAKDIAKDIKRRLLPDYLLAFEKAKAQKQEEDALDYQLDIAARALAKVTKGRVSPEYHNGCQRRVYFTNGQAEFFSDERVTLTLRDLTPDQAITIAAGLFHQTQSEE